ncbi:hypothetical protein ASD31_16150 [Rhizobium sp. Root482]|nr:hypothetical protein ASD31_16150 [Rhizobium sp. Root482]
MAMAAKKEPYREAARFDFTGYSPWRTAGIDGVESVMKTISGLFDNPDAAARAMEDLERMGISSDDISILSSDSKDLGTTLDPVETTTVGAGLGAAGGGAIGLAAGIGLMTAPALGPLVALGWLASALAGASAGVVAGGTIASLIDALKGTDVREEDAEVYEECLRQGGCLLVVRLGDEHFDAANAVLTQAGMVDTKTWRQRHMSGA